MGLVGEWLVGQWIMGVIRFEKIFSLYPGLKVDVTIVDRRNVKIELEFTSWKNCASNILISS